MSINSRAKSLNSRATNQSLNSPAKSLTSPRVRVCSCLAVSPSRKFVATGQMGQYPKIFVWNPIASPDPSDSPFKEAAVRILYHDIPALFCMEELPPKRLMDRRVCTTASCSLTCLVSCLS